MSSASSLRDYVWAPVLRVKECFGVDYRYIIRCVSCVPVKLQAISRRLLAMDIVPFIGSSGTTDEAQQEAAINNYFLQLRQENRQVNVFVNDLLVQQSLEERAGRRHRMAPDHIYNEASAHIRTREHTADAKHEQQLFFVRESTQLSVAQLNSENQFFQRAAAAESGTVQYLRAQLARTETV